MKRYGLLGEKLGHSYSKIIHEYIYHSLNIEASYTLLECAEEELKEIIDQLKKGVYQGFNVTIPYKKKIMDYLDVIDDKAKEIGSVNTIYLKDGKVVGTNTDYDGFLDTLKTNQIQVANKECYILGTGGAALAIRKALTDLNGKCHFVSRTPKGDIISYSKLENKKIDILVNTTPVGMYPDEESSPVSKKIATEAECVIDIIFNPLRTQLLKDANSNYNGLHMLIMQAIKAEELWQGCNTEDIKKVYDDLYFLLSLPKEIYELVKDLDFEKNTIGRSGDEVYIFENQYVLKISSSKENLLREKERMDWIEDKLPGPKSCLFIESDKKAYYLRTCVVGDSLIAKRFIEQPLLLIEMIVKAVKALRSLDEYSCPYLSDSSVGQSFIHGDLCLPNIYVNDNNELVGFIDLDHAGLGDPWEDYAWLIWSFEYNLKTKDYTNQLLEALQIDMDEEKYEFYTKGV